MCRDANPASYAGALLILPIERSIGARSQNCMIGGHCKVHACMYFLSDNYFFGRSNIDVILHGKLIFNYA